jgi:hypothetical protein
MMRTIKIEVFRGKMALSVDGVTGEACQQLTKPYLDRLGYKPGNSIETLKPEFHQTNDSVQELSQGS